MDDLTFQALASVRGLNANTLRTLFQARPDPGDWRDAHWASGLLTPRQHALMVQALTHPPQTIWPQLSGTRLIRCIDDEYPRALLDLPHPPKQLWVQGAQIDLNGPISGIVGSRQASLDGRKIAQSAACSAREQGHYVVSGGARGIDAAAHRASLSGTIAVMAGGLDKLYPRECWDLFAQIKTHGVLISEMPPGTQPKAQLFPVRNRIIAGLSQRLLVVQGRRDSGSLITARQALDLDREIWAVPGSPLLTQAQGPNELIRDGAQVWLTDSCWGKVQVIANQPHCPVGLALAENEHSAAELADHLNWPIGDVLAQITALKLAGSIRVVAGRYGWKS